MQNLKESLKGRDFLSLHDFTPEQVQLMVNYAIELKQKLKNGIQHHILSGQSLGMIFQKSSTRTRVSFEVGIYQLGGQGLFLSPNDIQMGRGESIADTARVLDRYLDGIMIRTYGHDEVEELAKYTSIPVINGLTDLLHPTQVIADLQTIQEHKGKLSGLKMVFIGDGNNVCHALMHGCAKTGMHFVAASPKSHFPLESILKEAREDALATGATINVTDNPEEAVTGADVLYSDVWASMGQESEQQDRMKVFAPYQLNEQLAGYANKDYLFLHCLPAHRGEEVTAEIIDGPHSKVFDEAENRLHAHKAIMALLMTK